MNFGKFFFFGIVHLYFVLFSHRDNFAQQITTTGNYNLQVWLLYDHHLYSLNYKESLVCLQSSLWSEAFMILQL